MRVLVVYPYVPYPVVRGTFQRTFHLLAQLGRRHEIDLFCLDAEESGPHRPVFEAFCRRVRFQRFRHPPWPSLFGSRLPHPLPTTVRHWHDPAAHAALGEFARDRTYDLILFCDLVLWPYVRRLPHRCPRVMDRSRVDLLFQTEELRTLRLSWKERFLRRENLWKLRRFERAAARELTATVVCGPDDETFMRREVDPTARLLVLANGCDPAYFDQDLFPPDPPAAPSWLFCGAMDYSPNVDGIRWYFDTADAAARAALPDRRVNLVGKSPVPAVRELGSRPGVTVTGEVPDVRPHYQRNHLQIVPLRIGGGTRLKIVESLAIGCPVVSTTLGAQGLDLRDGEHLLLADRPEDFAAAVVRLARDAGLRDRLRTAGRRQVLAHYGWPTLAARLDNFLRSLVPSVP
jgi:glycosyltransferase involved in cell wall biosynthesis